MIDLLNSTGIRGGELVKLNIDDVNVNMELLNKIREKLNLI